MWRRDTFKTKLCAFYARGHCPRDFCTFAHGEEDLRGDSRGGRSPSPRDSYDHRRPDQAWRPSDPSHRSAGDRAPDNYRATERGWASNTRRSVSPSRLLEMEDEKDTLLKDIDMKNQHIQTLETLLERKQELASELSSQVNLLEKEIEEKEAAYRQASNQLTSLLKAQHFRMGAEQAAKEAQAQLPGLVRELREALADFDGQQTTESRDLPLAASELPVNIEARKEQLSSSPSPKVLSGISFQTPKKRTLDLAEQEIPLNRRPKSAEVADYADTLGGASKTTCASMKPKRLEPTKQSLESVTAIQRVTQLINVESSSDVTPVENLGGSAATADKKPMQSTTFKSPEMMQKASQINACLPHVDSSGLPLPEPLTRSSDSSIFSKSSFPRYKSQVMPERTSLDQSVHQEEDNTHPEEPAVLGTRHFQVTRSVPKAETERQGEKGQPKAQPPSGTGFVKGSPRTSADKDSGTQKDMEVQANGWKAAYTAPKGDKKDDELVEEQQGMLGRRLSLKIRPDPRPFLAVKQLPALKAKQKGGPSNLHVQQQKVQQLLMEADEAKQRKQKEREERMKDNKASHMDVEKDEATGSEEHPSSKQHNPCLADSPAETAVHRPTDNSALHESGISPLELESHQNKPTSLSAATTATDVSSSKDASEAHVLLQSTVSAEDNAKFEYKYHFRPEDYPELSHPPPAPYSAAGDHASTLSANTQVYDPSHAYANYYAADDAYHPYAIQAPQEAVQPMFQDDASTGYYGWDNAEDAGCQAGIAEVDEPPAPGLDEEYDPQEGQTATHSSGHEL